MKEGETYHVEELGQGAVSKRWITRFKFMPPPGEGLLHYRPFYPKWQVGRTYAVQPGRGKKAVGRIRITEIRRERVQDISEEDAIAEGIYRHSDPCAWTYTYQGKEGLHFFGRAVWAFADLWDGIHKKPDTRWADNPETWALTFEVVRAAVRGRVD